MANGQYSQSKESLREENAELKDSLVWFEAREQAGDARRFALTLASDLSKRSDVATVDELLDNAKKIEAYILGTDAPTNPTPQV